jgi:hypothetical protein
MDARWPRSVFVLLVAGAAVHFSRYYPVLPPIVASHFDAHGNANGWQTKQGFFAVFAGVTVLAFSLVFAVPALIGAAPLAIINLPNKTYWLAPQQRNSSQAFLSSWFAWFGNVVFVVMFLTFDYAVKSNLQRYSAADPAHLWYVLAGFGGFSLVWMVLFFLRFSRLPRSPSDIQEWQ